MTEQNIMMSLPIVGIVLLLAIWEIFGTKQASSTIFMLSIYSLFLGSFFFTFGAWIEEQTVKNQIASLTKETMALYHLLVGDRKMSKLEISKDDKKSDQKVEDTNNKLVKQAMTLLVICCIVGIIISYIVFRFSDDFNVNKGLNLGNFFKNVAMKNIVILVFVAITQAIFFYTVSRTYKSLDINTIVRKTISDVEK